MSEIIKSIAIRRVSAGLLTAAALGLGTTGGLNVAQAAPGEWDVGAYDSCIARVENLWLAGDITDGVYIDSFHQCCRLSGGQWDTGSGPHGNCGAPPAVVADVPIGPLPEAADPDLGADPGPEPDPPKPTKKPPSAPTAPSGDNDGGTGSGDEGGGAAPVG